MSSTSDNIPTGSVVDNVQDQYYLQDDRRDLVGGPYAVIESDPGVFTSIIHKLGVQGVEAQEVMSLDDLDLVPSYRPYGFIFCFKWAEDSYENEDYEDETGTTLVPWFANQLSNDSCATLALLNILLNYEDIHTGPFLWSFKEFTREMDPKMRGLSIASSSVLREAHNSAARPSDLRASRSQIADVTIHLPKASSDKKAKHSKAKSKKQRAPEASLDQYHFISYIPYQGRVWEMDGYKKAPLECAELHDSNTFWVQAVLSALRGRIEALSRDGNTHFNILALIPSIYQSKIDNFELGKRQVTFIERRLQRLLGDTWKDIVPSDLYAVKEKIFAGPSSSYISVAFGARSNEMAMRILKMENDMLPSEWTKSVTRLVQLQDAIQDELKRAIETETECIKRTHDYEPFIQEYLRRLHNAGVLQGLLEVDGRGRPIATRK
ncbi:cysteine proteinase [Serendipita vermifera]|nr:cysteine proteinase [Serendipita vermifera]